MMQRLSGLNNDYDSVIQISIAQVLEKQKESFEDKIWQRVENFYTEQKKQFLSNLEEFRNGLHTLLDQYLLEKKLANKTPSTNSLELLGQIFMEIQSIQDIETTQMAYNKLKAMFSNGKGNSLTLHKCAKLIVENLSYYVNPFFGKCITPIKELFLKRERKKIDNHISAFERNLYLFIDHYLYKKYEEILNNNLPLKETLTTLDIVLASINQFNSATEARLAFPNFEENTDEYYYMKVKYEYDDNPWSPRSEKRIRELVKSLREIDKENYQMALEKETASKNETLRLIKSSLTPSIVLDSAKHLMADDAIDSAFDVFSTHLKKNIVIENHHSLLAINNQTICKRLSILLGEKSYLALINDLCIEINNQSIKEEFNMDIDRVSSSLQMKKNIFTLFGTVNDLPKVELTLSLTQGDAIRFLYANKAL